MDKHALRKLTASSRRISACPSSDLGWLERQIDAKIVCVPAKTRPDRLDMLLSEQEKSMKQQDEEASSKPLQGWRATRLRFLREAYPKKLRQFEKEGRLQDDLDDIAERAQELKEHLTSQLMEEALKEPDYNKRVQQLQGMPMIVDEVVKAEVLFETPL